MLITKEERMFSITKKEERICQLLSRFLDVPYFYGAGFKNTSIYQKAEIELIPILNIAFGMKFNLLEDTQPDYPSIDLGSSNGELSIQVTARKDTDSKVKETLLKYIKNEQHLKYNNLKILFLHNKTNYSTTIPKLNKYLRNQLPDFNENLIHDIRFCPNKSILDFTELIKLLKPKRELYDNVIKELENILPYLSKITEIKKQTSLKSVKTKELNEELKELNILDALYQLSVKFEGFPIQRNLKDYLYPFYNKKHFPRFMGYDCITHNEELIHFLKDIKKKNGKYDYTGNVKEIKFDKKAKAKIIAILDFLAKNNIYFVYDKYKAENRKIDLQNYTVPDNDSFYNAYFHMDLKKSLSTIDNTIKCSEKNIHILLQQALIYYEFGLYKKSYNVLIRLSRYTLNLQKNAKNNNKFIVRFICEYNLRMLWRYLHRYYYENKKVIKRCEDVDLNHLVTEFEKEGLNKDISSILHWIKNDEYINKKEEEISKILDQAKKNYNLDQNGKLLSPSFPSLHYRLDLFFNEFFKINEGYFLFNTKSVNFKKIIHSIIEIVLLMYQLSIKNNRVEKISEVWINITFLYSDPEELSKLFRKYKVKQLNILKNNNGSSLHFIYQLKNLVNSKTAIQNYFEKEYSKDNNIFFENLTKYVNNGIILTHHLNLNKAEFNTALKHLLTIFTLKEAQYLPRNTFNYLFNLIQDRRKEIFIYNLDALVKLKNTFPKKPIDFSYDFHNLYDLPRFKKEKEKYINEKIQYYKDHTNCHHTKYSEIYYLFELCSKVQKDNLIKAIERKLNSGFNDRTFHFYSLLGYISYNQYEEIFLETLVRNLNYKDFVDNRGAYTESLDMFINLAYKYDLILTDEKYQKIKKLYLSKLTSISELVHYCEFLFDPENFNYENFDAKWLLKNPHYRSKKLFKINEVEEGVIGEIERNNNKELALLYVKYFVKPSEG